MGTRRESGALGDDLETEGAGLNKRKNQGIENCSQMWHRVEF
ncbi:hypothetical protein GCM10010129_84560 [Streptomyces fumigatiscleroticus]|nr:hypothetical protein GCM10010129_84560 [Streptomyces fumigatiscleroticus]